MIQMRVFFSIIYILTHGVFNLLTTGCLFKIKWSILCGVVKKVIKY